MKKTLLLASVALASLGAFAQRDITPARYQFASQPEGQYAFDEFITGANPTANYANAVEKFADGYIVANNGQFGNENVVSRFKSGTNIVDLGGEVGKVLCIKGVASTYEYGTPMNDVLPPNWFNLSFYLAPESHAVDQPVRFRCVFRVLRNTPDLTKTVVNLDAYTFRNDSYVANFSKGDDATEFDKANADKWWGSGDFIARYDDDNSPKEDDNSNYYYEDDLWQVAEFDYAASNADGVPFRYVIHWNNENIGEYVLLIKELSATVEAEGEPVVQKIHLGAAPDAIQSLISGNAQQQAFDLSGRQVRQTERGIYLQAGKKVIK